MKKKNNGKKQWEKKWKKKIKLNKNNKSTNLPKGAADAEDKHVSHHFRKSLHKRPEGEELSSHNKGCNQPTLIQNLLFIQNLKNSLIQKNKQLLFKI